MDTTRSVLITIKTNGWLYFALPCGIKPESTLKKKSNSICYHTEREAVAMGEALTAHIRSENNPADLATKVLYGGKRRHHAGELLYDLYDDF